MSVSSDVMPRGVGKGSGDGSRFTRLDALARLPPCRLPLGLDELGDACLDGDPFPFCIACGNVGYADDARPL